MTAIGSIAHGLRQSGPGRTPPRGRMRAERPILTGPRGSTRVSAETRVPAAESGGWISKPHYLYVTLLRNKKSRCGAKSTMDPSAGPANGLAFIASPNAALALSNPAEVGQM